MKVLNTSPHKINNNNKKKIIIKSKKAYNKAYKKRYFIKTLKIQQIVEEEFCFVCMTKEMDRSSDLKI